MKWHDGVVRWFDNRSGEGMIRVDERSIYVHWSAIANGLDESKLPAHAFKQPKHVWCILFSNQKVKVRIFEDSHFIQISEVA